MVQNFRTPVSMGSPDRSDFEHIRERLRHFQEPEAFAAARLEVESKVVQWRRATDQMEGIEPHYKKHFPGGRWLKEGQEGGHAHGYDERGRILIAYSTPSRSSFPRMSIKVSTASRSQIPRQADHGFHGNSIRVSTGSRSRSHRVLSYKLLDSISRSVVGASSQITNEQSKRNPETAFRFAAQPS